ncbi:MAG TPA: GNAT family N-acetyltransferase [Pseudonocardiaceae bacterium]|jgi:predicted GNAT family acetyltransferase|nr:GNAT family N-acetyltransferase [Pseudonocardiaceae bacterium]
MRVRLLDDLAEFTALTRPLLAADPVTHTVALTVIEYALRVPPAVPPVLVAVDGAAAALCTPPRGLITSALPPEWSPAVAGALADVHPGLPEVTGPRDRAEAFALAWSDLTGAVVQERRTTRLFALATLTTPGAVPGRARLATTDDLDLLTRWRRAFAEEAVDGPRPGEDSVAEIRNQLQAGAAHLLWCVDDESVSHAATRPPVAGMSRIGPVYTPPEHREHGYASAVTAAAAAWALAAGARHVVLFTDLANPVSNSIYPRLGFCPVHDAVELDLQCSP